MAAIDNGEINRIQQSANIVEIIGSYITLEKKLKKFFFIFKFNYCMSQDWKCFFFCSRI